MERVFRWSSRSPRGGRARDLTAVNVKLTSGVHATAALPDQRPTGTPRSRMPARSTSPARAKAAYRISAQGSSFGPWATYKSGAYTRNLDIALVAIQLVTSLDGRGGRQDASFSRSRRPGQVEC